MLKIYGIKNCNSVKKALDFCDKNKISYDFHDYKKLGADKELLGEFIEKFGLDKVVNKKGTTYKKLDEKQRELCENEDGAIGFMITNTSLIKRPIIIDNDATLIGFDEEVYSEALL